MGSAANGEGERQDSENQILGIRKNMQMSQIVSSSSPDNIRQGLAQRKRQGLPAVLTLETLAKVLPDHTYLTELRIEGNKLRLVGITRDAPSLIALLEQSKHFSRASFFAPTTRSSTHAGERFHIEALVHQLPAVQL